MTTYMPQWHQQSPVHPSMGHYMDHPLNGHWPTPSSMPPHQSLPHPAHGMSILQHLSSQPHQMRQHNNQHPLSALPSPVQNLSHSHSHSHSHSQSLQHPQQTLPPVLSLPPPEPLQLSQQAPHYPLHHQVVGQQGIRGVLPSAAGEPSSPDDNCEPEQDEKDGSWPCKCCGKRYRHAKHLRRHHARHTGDTPYECPLCSRRFGRSDVLKRHYHKCATRRGQPVGDHLAGQRGHPRRQRVKGGSLDGQSAGYPDGGSPINNGSIDVKQPITPVTHSMDGMNPSYMG